MTASADGATVPEGWLVALASFSPNAAACLSGCEISSDEAYLAQRPTLPESVRVETDTFRYSFLKDEIQQGDPFLLARIAPLSNLNLPLGDLPLSTRCSRVLHREKIKSLSDLLPFTLDLALHDWKNFGRTSARELATRIRGVIDNQGRSSDADLASLFDCVSGEMEHVGARNAQILADRIGVGGGWRTLEAIARDHDLTRQRVDQIVGRWLRATENRPWRRELRRRLDAALAKRDQPLYLDLLDNEDSWFRGWPEPLNLGNAVEIFTDSQIRVLNVAGLHVLTRLHQQTWDRLPGQAIAYLKSLGPALSESETRLAVEGFAEAHAANGLGELLYLTIRDRLQFAEQGGEVTLSSIGGGLIHHVKAVLDAAERPLHYTDIAKHCQDRMGRDVSPTSVGNFLPAAGAKYFGRGQWGQARHYSLSDATRSELVREAECVAVSGQPERQWHADELLAEISRRRKFEGIDKYALNYALERSGVLVSKGRLVWALKAHSDRERIDVGDACEQIVRTKGRPMTRAELVAALSKHRGLGKHLNITSRSQLIRVSPGTWGLLERDFRLTSEQTSRLLARLHSVLATARKPMAESDLLAFIAAAGADHLTPYMLRSLAQRDERFALHRRRGVGLAEWRGMRGT